MSMAEKINAQFELGREGKDLFVTMITNEGDFTVYLNKSQQHKLAKTLAQLMLEGKPKAAVRKVKRG